MMTPLKKRERQVIARLLMLWVFMLAFFVPQYAYAYIDPATTTYIIQIIAAVIITLGVSFSIVLYRFRMLFTKAWVLIRSGGRRQEGRTQDQAGAKGSTSAAEPQRIILDYVLANSSEPPEKAFGFGYDDEDELARLAQNYSVVESKFVDTDSERGRGRESSTVSPRGTSTIKERVAWLLNDKRSFKLRLGLAALISASLVFTTLVFGPLELFATSRNDMLFDLDYFLGPLLLVAFIAFTALTALLVILRGRLFDAALCVITSIVLACYIQATFLNGFIGQLTGAAIRWEAHSTETALSLAVWLAVAVVVFFVRFASAKVWQTGTVFFGSALIAIQLIALVSISSDITRVQPAAERDLVLTEQGTLELSNQKNVVVFLLDMLDREYVNQVKIHDPSFFNGLDGFIEYPDNITRYPKTFPSISYSLTGLENNYDKPRNEFLVEAYDQHLFVDDLAAAGWTSKLYLSEGYDFLNKSQLTGRAANLANTADVLAETEPMEAFVTKLRLIKRLDQLSLFRYAPTALKPVFWTASTEISQPVLDARQEYSSAYQLKFMDDLHTRGLTTDSEKPVFMYYHLDGPHGPHQLNAEGWPSSEGPTDPITETQGCFNIIYEYIKQLKALGIYDETCIIITGDHGRDQVLTGLFYKPTQATDQPLSLSTAPVSDRNLVPTIIEQAQVKSTAEAAEGLAYSEVTAENTPLREYDIAEGGGSLFWMSRFSVKGAASDPGNWTMIDRVESTKDYWTE